MWQQRACEAWQTLARRSRHRVPARPGRFHEPRRLRVVPAWPLSQVLHAAILLSAAGVPTGAASPDAVWESFRRYRRGDGFLDFPLFGTRYYDDNAWIGLACAQQALWTEGPERTTWRRRAEASLRFVAQGVRRDGGILWVEGGENLHACSTGSAGLLAAAVTDVDGFPRPMAARAGEFIDHELVAPNGLIADHITPDGRVDASEFTYNQGLAIQLRIERGLIDHAVDLGDRATAAFTGERLWEHPPAFNAIFCRALLRLDAVTGKPRFEPYVTDYAERMWHDGRDGRGLFAAAGRYDEGYVLDHAAVSGLLAALALPAERRLLLL